MPVSKPLRPLLPAQGEVPGEFRGTSQIKKTKVSLACIECRKKRTKCTGEVPCIGCTMKGCECVFDPRTDRRRRSHLFELTRLNQAFEKTVAQLRSGKTDEVKLFLSQIRSFQTDQETIAYLMQRDI